MLSPCGPRNCPPSSPSCGGRYASSWPMNWLPAVSFRWPIVGSSVPTWEFTRKRGMRGWLGMTIPQQYSGGGRSPLERFVVIRPIISLSGEHYFNEIRRSLLDIITVITRRMFGVQHNSRSSALWQTCAVSSAPLPGGWPFKQFIERVLRCSGTVLSAGSADVALRGGHRFVTEQLHQRSSTFRAATRTLRWTAAPAQSHRRQPMAHDDGLRLCGPVIRGYVAGPNAGPRAGSLLPGSR